MPAPMTKKEDIKPTSSRSLLITILFIFVLSFSRSSTFHSLLGLTSLIEVPVLSLFYSTPLPRGPN